LPLTIHPSSYLSGVGPVSNLNMTFGKQGEFPRVCPEPVLANNRFKNHFISSQNDGRFFGAGRTYRRIGSQATDALFSFGWGLSYSQFAYSKLVCARQSCVCFILLDLKTMILPRQARDKHRGNSRKGTLPQAASKTSVSVMVTNTGKKAAAEVAELYLTLDGAGSALPPVPHALAGFEKVRRNVSLIPF
jgi:hypothetical protein